MRLGKPARSVGSSSAVSTLRCSPRTCPAIGLGHHDPDRELALVRVGAARSPAWGPPGSSRSGRVARPASAARMSSIGSAAEVGDRGAARRPLRTVVHSVGASPTPYSSFQVNAPTARARPPRDRRAAPASGSYHSGDSIDASGGILPRRPRRRPRPRWRGRSRSACRSPPVPGRRRRPVPGDVAGVHRQHVLGGPLHERARSSGDEGDVPLCARRRITAPPRPPPCRCWSTRSARASRSRTCRRTGSCWRRGSRSCTGTFVPTPRGVQDPDQRSRMPAGSSSPASGSSVPSPSASAATPSTSIAWLYAAG